METTNTPILPRLSRFVGKVIAESGVGFKDATIAGAKGSARLAGQCAREFVEGLKEGKRHDTAEGHSQTCGHCHTVQPARNRHCSGCGDPVTP